MRRMKLWCLIIKRKEIILWIHVYPTTKINFNSKTGRKRKFYYETKASLSFIPMKRMCLWFLVMKKRILLRESVFITIDIWTLILKNGGKWGFSYETKASIHLSQWGEWIWGAQSLKESRLLCESMFIQIERQSLI